jgi:hypothetical protein
MKRNTPLITLLTGAALGVALLIASMLSTPAKAPAGYAAPAATTSSAPATPAAPASTAATAPAQAPSSPAATATPAGPKRADYAGTVYGGAASLAISVHNGQVIAYVCNGSVIEAWLKGAPAGGRLVMTGKNHSQLSATYGAGKYTGEIVTHGTMYRFSVPVVQKPSGLYRATAVVRGATIKAGWIVLPNGTQVGSIESDPNAAAPSATQAPVLDLATGTARDGDIVLHAVPVSGITGSGF